MSGLVTLAAIAVPLILACWLVARRFDAPIPLLSAGRACFAAACALASVSLVDVDGFLGIFVRCGLAGVVFLLCVVFSGEITRGELATAKRLIGRGS